MYERKISLTRKLNRGYLFPLSPSPHMRTPNAPQEFPNPNESPQSPSIMKRLRSVAGSTRAKVAAAFLAAAGAVESANKAEAGLVLSAEVVPGSQVNEIGDDEFGFGWEGGQLRVDNLEDQSSRDIYWYGFHSTDETKIDASLPIPGHTPEPDRIIGPNAIPDDDIMSPDLILDGQLQVRQNFLVGMGLYENGNTQLGADKFIEGSEVYIGLSPIEGDPQNIDEAIAMTDGVVYKGIVPSHLDPNKLYVVRPTTVHAPEPSAAVLGGLAAGGAAAFGARRRKRTK